MMLVDIALSATTLRQYMKFLYKIIHRIHPISHTWLFFTKVKLSLGVMKFERIEEVKGETEEKVTLNIQIMSLRKLKIKKNSRSLLK